MIKGNIELACHIEDSGHHSRIVGIGVGYREEDVPFLRILSCQSERWLHKALVQAKETSIDSAGIAIGRPILAASYILLLRMEILLESGRFSKKSLFTIDIGIINID